MDIDPRHDGNESLDALIAEYGELPMTVEAETGGGGRHPIFRHPGGEIHNRTNIRPGIDVRGDGGYIVAPPSTHISGQHYTWKFGHAPSDVDPAPLRIMARTGAALYWRRSSTKRSCASSTRRS